MTEQEPKPDKVRVVDFVDQFADALKEQLLVDEKFWGDTWLNRPIKGQEERTMKEYEQFYRDFKWGQPMPWLKVAGDALICWVREQHPELFKKE